MKFVIRKEAECLKYMKLLYKDKEYTLEEFSDEYKSGEFSLEKLLGDCTLIYKGKKIPFEEYISNSNEFSRSLKIFDRYHKEIVPIEMKLLLSNYEYYKAAKFLEKAEDCLQIARYYLQSCNDILEYDCNLNWKGTYGAIFDIRAMNFKTAVIWYNNCFDYILQIVFLAFQLYKLLPDYTSNWKLKDILRSCNYQYIYDLCMKNSENEHYLALSNILKECNNGMNNIAHWANYSKHKGGIDIVGLKPSPLFELSIQDADGQIQEIPTEFEPVMIDLDKSISVLYDAHNILFKCMNEIVDFIDFQGAVPKKDGDGKLIIPDKHSYVKILLEH